MYSRRLKWTSARPWERRRQPSVYLGAQPQCFVTIEAGKPGASPWTAGSTSMKTAGGDIWSPFHGDVDQTKVMRAKSLRLQVIVWTVNGAARMPELIDRGVDGIICDYADRLVEVLKAL